MHRSLAWRLWQLMSNPPAHSHLYTRTFHEEEPVRAQSASVVFGVIIGMFLLSGGVAVLILFVPLLSPVMGAVWAYSIGGAVRNRVYQLRDLLAITPNGALGGYLHTALGLMHRQQRFNDMIGVEISMLRTVGSMIINLPLMWWFVFEPVDEMRLITVVLIFAASTLLTRALFWIVHILCIELGTLCALTFGTFGWGTPIVQLGGLLLYIFIVSVIAMGTALTVRALSPLFPVVTNVIWAQLYMLLMLAILTEGVVRGMWSLLLFRLNAHIDAQILI